MGQTLIEASIEEFVENLEESLSRSKLDALLGCLNSHGLNTNESYLRILQGYVSKIRQLSRLFTGFYNAQNRVGSHYSGISSTYMFPSKPVKKANNETRTMRRPSSYPSTCACRKCNSLHCSRKKSSLLMSNDHAEAYKRNCLDIRSKGDNFTEAVIKNLRKDVATKLRYIRQNDQQHQMANAIRRQPNELEAIFNPSGRLAGGAETGASEADQQRVQNLLQKMTEIEGKINDFKERALTASRLKSEVEQLQATLETERELNNAKLISVEADFRKQIAAIESQVQISRKERNIYQKLAKKLEYEVRRGEKEKEKYKRRSEELEAKLKDSVANGIRYEKSSDISKQSFDSINKELSQTKEALRNIERKHDALLTKLDATIVS